jgi:hypothetical protein
MALRALITINNPFYASAIHKNHGHCAKLAQLTVVFLWAACSDCCCELECAGEYLP